MLRSVLLTEAELKVVAGHIDKDIEYLKSEISDLNEKLDALYSRYADIMQRPHSDLIKEDYNVFTGIMPPLWQRVKLALLKIGKFSTTRVIATTICEIEGSEVTYKELSKMVGDISATLAPKVKKGKDFSKVEEWGEVFFGLIEWIDDEGNMLAGHSFKSTPEEDFSDEAYI